MVNQLSQQVLKILTSAVGEFIARATMKKNCELIGTNPEELSPEELPELAARIEKSVSFFAGKDVGKDVAEKIRGLGSAT